MIVRYGSAMAFHTIIFVMRWDIARFATAGSQSNWLMNMCLEDSRKSFAIRPWWRRCISECTTVRLRVRNEQDGGSAHSLKSPKSSNVSLQ
jgi:hypothetical protein